MGCVHFPKTNGLFAKMTQASERRKGWGAASPLVWGGDQSRLCTPDHSISSAIPACSCRHKWDAQNWKEQDPAKEEHRALWDIPQVLNFILRALGNGLWGESTLHCSRLSVHTQPGAGYRQHFGRYHPKMTLTKSSRKGCVGPCSRNMLCMFFA